MSDGVDLAELATSFSAAIEDGDFGRAETTAVNLDAATPGGETVADAFGTALGNDDDGAARVLLAKARERYEAGRADMGAEIERSLLARRRGDVTTSEKQALGRHVDRGAKLAMSRGGFLSTAGGFFIQSETTAGDRDTLLSTTQALARTERQFGDDRRRAVSLAGAQTLPADVEIVDATVVPEPPVRGERATATVHLANVGDEPATTVRLTAAAPDDVRLTPSDRVLPELPANERATATFAVVSEGLGERRLRFEVSADPGGTAFSETSFGVVDRTPVVRALDRDQDGLLDTEDVQRAVEYWYEDDPVPDTGGQTLAKDDLYRVIRLWANDVRVSEA